MCEVVSSLGCDIVVLHRKSAVGISGDSGSCLLGTYPEIQRCEAGVRLQCFRYLLCFFVADAIALHPPSAVETIASGPPATASIHVYVTNLH